MGGRMRRRQVLGSAGVAAAGLVGSIAFPAHALRLEQAPAALAEHYRAACTAEADFHARLRRDLATALAAQGVPADPDALARLVSGIACPRCGCPLG